MSGQMSFHEFEAAAKSGRPPPAEIAPLLRALWLDAQGDWAAAHALAQDDATPDGAWVHAYLHRREGDIGNAHYWYARARRAPSSAPLEAEWREIAGHLL
jgi:hypothetical protein